MNGKILSKILVAHFTYTPPSPTGPTGDNDSLYHSSVSHAIVKSICSRKLIIIYSKSRSRRTFAKGDCSSSGPASPRAERRERSVTHASLSHSVKARESSVADLFARPARWEVVWSIVRMERRIPSIEDWNS